MALRTRGPPPADGRDALAAFFGDEPRGRRADRVEGKREIVLHPGHCADGAGGIATGMEARTAFPAASRINA